MRPDVTESLIQNISDTALWVASYRALESRRADALFQDPFAEILAGERGQQIAASMNFSRYTQWTIVLRTVIIDRFITNLIAGGADTVINLGCGLDSRPYRMNFTTRVRWIEVDYPHMIEHKRRCLESFQPHCSLERIALDLADLEKRAKLFDRFASETKSAVILTEGVIPYLNLEQAASLTSDLRRHDSFRAWITDYFSPQLMEFMRTPECARKMKQAPFVFDPPDWHQYFADLGWKATQTRFVVDEAMALGRPPPHPLWLRIKLALRGREHKLRQLQRQLQQLRRTAYIIMEPTPLP